VRDQVLSATVTSGNILTDCARQGGVDTRLVIMSVWLGVERSLSVGGRRPLAIAWPAVNLTVRLQRRDKSGGVRGGGDGDNDRSCGLGLRERGEKM
jgi:hypothetical protein